MNKFFDDYFNISKIIKSKREYKQFMARVNALPRDYRYVFKKIQNHMWQFAAGAGYDMIEVQGGLLELFEQGVTDGKNVLDVTGKDVAGFCDELLKSVNTTKSKHKDKFNRDILDKLDK